jgi:hypothetical protein
VIRAERQNLVGLKLPRLANTRDFDCRFALDKLGAGLQSGSFQQWSDAWLKAPPGVIRLRKRGSRPIEQPGGGLEAGSVDARIFRAAGRGKYSGFALD